MLLSLSPTFNLSANPAFSTLKIYPECGYFSPAPPLPQGPCPIIPHLGDCDTPHLTAHFPPSPPLPSPSSLLPTWQPARSRPGEDTGAFMSLCLHWLLISLRPEARQIQSLLPPPRPTPTAGLPYTRSCFRSLRILFSATHKLFLQDALST